MPGSAGEGEEGELEASGAEGEELGTGKGEEEG